MGDRMLRMQHVLPSRARLAKRCGWPVLRVVVVNWKVRRGLGGAFEGGVSRTKDSLTFFVKCRLIFSLLSTHGPTHGR